MSLATLKKKTQAKYNNNSVNELQFSTVGPYRNQGRVGQSTQSRSLTGPNSNGTTLCSKNDNTVVKKASMNTNGMLLSRFRWLRRPYDAAQPLDSISLKPGAGNILYGSQDAYIERKRKEAVCCDTVTVTVTNFAHTLVSYNATNEAHSKNTIIGLVTPSSYGTGFTNQETNKVDSDILDSALGTTTLENVGYVKDGSSYTKYNVGDNNTSNTVFLSDTTANYLNNLDLASTSPTTTTFTTFSLDGNVEINTKEHTVTLVDYELSQLATHVNTRKGSLLSDGDVFFANTGVLLQYGDLYTNTPNVTVPNIFGDATSNNDIEKAGVMAGLLTTGAHFSGNDYELSTNDLQLLVYAIYYNTSSNQTTSTLTSAESIIISYQALQVGLTAYLTAATRLEIENRVSTGLVTTQEAIKALAQVTALETQLSSINTQVGLLRNSLARLESGNPTTSQGWAAVNAIQQAITQDPLPVELQSTITNNLTTITTSLTAVNTEIEKLIGDLPSLTGILSEAQLAAIQQAVTQIKEVINGLLGEINNLISNIPEGTSAQQVQQAVSTALTDILPTLRTTLTEIIRLVSLLVEELVSTVDVKMADAVKTVELPGNPVNLSSVFSNYVKSLSNWPFPTTDPLTGQYFNGNILVEGSNITDAQLTAFNRLAELQADQELARILLTYQYYKTQVSINWIGGADGYKKTVETLTNSLVIDKIKNNLTMGELIRMGNLYNNAWTKRNIKTPLPMVAINLFYQLLNDYNDYGGNTDSYLIGYNSNGGYIKEDAPYSRNKLTLFSDWDKAETSFYDFFWVMVNDILYVDSSYPAPDPANRDAVLYQINPYDSSTDTVFPATKTVKVSDVLAFKVNSKDVFAVPDKYIQMSTVMYANQAYQSTHSALSLPAMSFVNLENQSGSLTDFLTEWDKFYNSLTAVISNLNNRSSIPYAVPTIGDIISVNNSFYLVSGYSTSNTTRTSSYNSQLLTGTNLGNFSVSTLFGTISGITGTDAEILTALQYIQVSNTYVSFGSTPLSAGARELIADVINGSTTLRQFTSIKTIGPSTQTQGTLTATTLPISSRNSDIIAKATEVNNQFARLVTWVTTTIGGIYTGATTNIANNGFNYYQNATPPVNQIPVNTIGIRTGSNTIQERGILGSLYYFGALTGGGISFSLNTEQLERLMAIIYIWSSIAETAPTVAAQAAQAAAAAAAAAQAAAAAAAAAPPQGQAAAAQAAAAQAAVAAAQEAAAQAVLALTQTSLTEAVILTFMLQDDGFDENYLVTSEILQQNQLDTLKTTIYIAFATGAATALIAASQQMLAYETAEQVYATNEKNNATTQEGIDYWDPIINFWNKQVQTTTLAINTLQDQNGTVALLAQYLLAAAQTSGQQGANDHLKGFVTQAVGNTNIKPLRSNNVFYIQRTDVLENTSTINLAYEYRSGLNYEPMTSIQKYYVNGLAILIADQNLFRSYARLSLLSQVQLFWTSELQSQLASIGEGGLSSYVDVINLLQTQLVVNVIETEAQLFIVKVLNAVYKLRRNSDNNTKLDYKALLVLYMLLSYVIDFSANLIGIDFELRTDNNGDPVFIKSDPEPVLVIDVNNSVQTNNNDGRYIIDSFNSSVGGAYKITNDTVTTDKIDTIRTDYNGKVKIESGGGNYDLLIQNLANFFYVYTETSNKYINTDGAGGDYMFYITEFDDPDNTNTVYPIVYTSRSSIYSTYQLRKEYFYLYNTMSFAASQNPLVETNLNNILTQADDFTTAISNMKTTLAGGSNPNSVVTIGDVVRINGKFYVVQSNDANGLVVINKDDSSVSIEKGSTIHLVYKGDTATPNVYLDSAGPIGTSLLSGGTSTTTTKSNDCCLLDIDKAFLDQNNQQKRCGSTNTCG